MRKNTGSNLEENLLDQLRLARLPEPEREFLFCKTLWRRFKFDFCWPSLKVAAECEGGSWVTGAHVRGKPFESDAVKYSLAALLGYTVLRFSNHMVSDGRAITLIGCALGLYDSDALMRVAEWRCLKCLTKEERLKLAIKESKRV